MLEQWKIELIEDLPLDGTERWYVLLACLGHKKGSWFIMHSDIWREGDAPNRIPESRLDTCRNTFEKLGLHCKMRLRDSDAGLRQPDDNDGRTRMNQLCDIYLATSDDRACELEKAVELMDHERIGRALDFPSTAIAAFCAGGDELLPFGKIPLRASRELLDVLQFRLSKKHYKDELRVIQRWLDALKDNSSIIYFELNRKSR